MPHRSTRRRYEELVAAARRARAARRADAPRPKGDLDPRKRRAQFDDDAPKGLADVRQTGVAAAESWRGDAAAAPAETAAPAAALAEAAVPATATAAGLDELSLLTWIYILPAEAQEGVLRFFRVHGLATVKRLVAFIDNDTQKNRVGRPQRLLDRLTAAADGGPLPTIDSLSEFFAGAAIVNKRS